MARSTAPKEGAMQSEHGGDAKAPARGERAARLRIEVEGWSRAAASRLLVYIRTASSNARRSLIRPPTSPTPGRRPEQPAEPDQTVPPVAHLVLEGFELCEPLALRGRWERPGRSHLGFLKRVHGACAPRLCVESPRAARGAAPAAASSRAPTGAHASASPRGPRGAPQRAARIALESEANPFASAIARSATAAREARRARGLADRPARTPSPDRRARGERRPREGGEHGSAGWDNRRRSAGATTARLLPSQTYRERGTSQRLAFECGRWPQNGTFGISDLALVRVGEERPPVKTQKFVENGNKY